MTFEVRISTTSLDASQLCCEILHHQLHHPGREGLLKDLCLRFMQHNLLKPIGSRFKRSFIWICKGVKYRRPRYLFAVAYARTPVKTPIGCLVVDGLFLHVYVKPQFRRLGCATDLMTALSSEFNLTRVINLGETPAAMAFQLKFSIQGLKRIQ